MRKSQHGEAEIIAALKQVEEGRKVENVAREYSVSKHTIYGGRRSSGAWMLDVWSRSLMAHTFPRVEGGDMG